MNKRIGFATKASLLSAAACVILCPAIGLIAQSNTGTLQPVNSVRPQPKSTLQSAIDREVQALSESRQAESVGQLNRVAPQDDSLTVTATYFPGKLQGGIVQTAGEQTPTVRTVRPAAAQVQKSSNKAPLRFSPPNFARRLIDKITGETKTPRRVVKRSPVGAAQPQATPTPLSPMPEPSLGASQPESEITRQLKMLYAQDGQKMPPMTFSALPDTPEEAKRAAQNRNMTKRSGSSTPRPSNPIDYVKNLFGSKPAPRRTAARNLPKPQPQQVFPQVRPIGPSQKTAGIEADLAPLPEQTAPQDPNEPALADTPRLISKAAAESSEAEEKSAPEFFETAVKEASPAKLAVDAKLRSPLADDLGNPFTETTEEQADQAGTPFTGLKLEESSAAPVAKASQTQESAPVDAPESKESDASDVPQITPNPFVNTAAAEPKKVEPAASDVDESKDSSGQLKKIAQRGDRDGLKGFCIVSLRDSGKLLDGRADLTSTFQARTYSFASAEAKSSFDSNPEKYALAASGNDVILLAAENQSIRGSLDHALWFRGRLYLFGSSQTMELFQLSPADYATDAE